jgi:hypothetical protein
VKANKKAIVGVLLSVAALTYTLWDVSFKDLGTALGEAKLVWLVPAIATTLAMFAVRALRWSVIMGRVPFSTAYHALNIGYMFNITLPFRVGELARCYAVAQKTDVPMARALSSVVVERLTDLAAVVLLFALFTQMIPMPAKFSRAAALASGATVAGVLFGVVLVVKGAAVERLARPRLERLTNPESTERWLKRFRDLCDGFRAIGSARRVAVSLGLTVLIWALSVLLTFFFLRAFMPADVSRAGMVVVMSNLGGALPSAPGGLGIVQAFAKDALVIPFGVPEDKAVAFAFVWSLGQQLFLMALGLFGLGRLGMSFSSARAGARQTSETTG